MPLPKYMNLVHESLELLRQQDHLGKLEHIEQAISLQKEALALTPEGHPNRSMVLNALGWSFRMRFEHQGELKDINKAIRYILQAIKLSPAGYMSPLFLNLGISYCCRFERSNKLKDLECAMSFQAQAIFCTQDLEYVSTLLNEIGILFHKRFMLLKDRQDINHAIVFQKQSVVSRSEHIGEDAIKLMNLGRSLRDRFEHLDKKEDIDEAVNYFQRSVDLTLDNQIALESARLNNLATALVKRFEHQGILADLDKSVQLYRQSLLLVPDDHPEKIICLNNLGHSLQIRFVRLGELDDINKAIEYLKQAVSFSSSRGVSKPGLSNNLGNSLMCRFDLLKTSSDLDEAIYLFEQALRDTSSNDVYRSRWLNNLAYSLSKRFNLQGDVKDLNSSIEYSELAILFTIDNDEHKAGWLANLGNAYLTRFVHLKKQEDLDKSIERLKNATNIIPKGHRFRTGILSLLGISYKCRFLHSHWPLDLILSICAFYEAACLPAGEPRQRFDAALNCAQSSILFDMSFALKLYELAIDLLPSVIWLGTTIHRRYQNVHSIGSAVSEAAAVAIAMKEYELALEWLEQGRSIVWQQVLNLRTQFDELSKVDPKLADRLDEIARQLEHMSTPKPNSRNCQTNTTVPEQEAQAHRRLAEEWDRTIDQARRIPGFHSFMRPRKASELVQAAQSGAVVVINVQRDRCDALILRPQAQGVMHVPLPDFSLLKATTAYKQLIASLEQKGIRERGFKAGQTQQGDKFESILALLWSDVVRPVLHSLGYLVRICAFILLT